MPKLIETRNSNLNAALVASVITAGLTFSATAEPVTLTTANGDSIVGDLIEFKDNAYLINTTIGQMSVSVEKVTCSGDACPTIGPVTWDVSLWGKRRAFTEHVEKLAELLDEKTDGDFTLNLSYGGLSPSRENLDGISKGAFEMAQFCAGYHPKKNQSLNVLELPFLGVSSLEEEVRVSLAVYAHPFTKIDMAQWNATLLMPSPQPQQNIMGTGVPPFSLAEFESMTIRATGGIADAVSALGAEPMSIPAPGVAEAMDTGVVDAVSFAPHAHMAFGTLNKGSWWTTNLNPGTANCPVVVNTTALSALSEDHRTALLSSVDAALDHYVTNYEGVTLKAWGPALRERSIMELTFNDEIIQGINEAVAIPSARAWIEENSARGLPARDLYNLVMQTLGKEVNLGGS